MGAGDFLNLITPLLRGRVERGETQCVITPWRRSLHKWHRYALSLKGCTVCP